MHALASALAMPAVASCWIWSPWPEYHWNTTGSPGKTTRVLELADDGAQLVAALAGEAAPRAQGVVVGGAEAGGGLGRDDVAALVAGDRGADVGGLGGAGQRRGRSGLALTVADATQRWQVVLV